MWNLVQNDNTRGPSPEYNRLTAISSAMNNLQGSYLEMKGDYELKDSDLYKNLASIYDKIGGTALLFTLLRNVPNMTFGQIMDKVGHERKDIVTCETNCTNFTELGSGQFPRCFHYAMSESLGNDKFDDGISNGIQFLLMTGVQLMYKEFDRILTKGRAEESEGKFAVNNVHLFEDEWSPSSANGIRLTLSSPGISPSIDEKGINISPGYYTLISITAKEIIRLPWPYSDCVTVDYEMQKLKKNVIKLVGFIPDEVTSGDHYEYDQQECRSACLQNHILSECQCLDLESRLPFTDIQTNIHLCGALRPAEMTMLLKPGNKTLGCLTTSSELLSANCSFLHKIINDLACVKRVKERFVEKKLSGTLDCHCAISCHSYEYDMNMIWVYRQTFIFVGH